MKADGAPKYDLEERTEVFASDVRRRVRGLAMTVAHLEDAKQLVRASGSVAANYIEANDALSKKDFVMHIKICRKESKESRLWLRLLDLDGPISDERGRLAQEATELTNIFGAILRKSE
ncbi:MAG: four helix bundle protein [Lentisphaerae bacterium]|nr:four helix bundle protein [Lentisphaerota bacterium]